MEIGNKLRITIGVAAILGIALGIGKLLPVQAQDTSPVVSHFEVIPATNSSSAPTPAAPSAKASGIATPKNVLFLNTQVDEYSVNSLITQLQQLEGSKEAIYLLIDSPGGSVYDGARLITQMEGMKTPVNTVCVGLCASMGAMIHSYGDQRLITNRSTLMYHPASGGLRGQLQNMQSRLNSVLSFVGKLEANVQKRSGMTKEAYDKAIAYELWVDSDEAKAANLVDDVVSLNVSIPSASESNEDNKTKITRDFDLIWIYLESSH